MTAMISTEQRIEASRRMQEHQQAAKEAWLRGEVVKACKEAWLAEELAAVLCPA